MWIFIFTCLLSLTSLTHFANCKQFSMILEASQLKQHNGWVFVGKVGLRQGDIQVKFQTQKIQGHPKTTGGQIVLNLIPYSFWEPEQLQKCSRPMMSPIIVHELQLNGNVVLSHHSLKIQQEQMYYLVLKDCGQHFQADYNSFDLQISVEIEIINNGDYLGEEQDHWLTVPLSLSIGVWVLLSNKDFLKQENQNDPDYAKMIGFGALATNFSSLMWRSFGYLIYRNWGVNYLLFHLVYLFMHSVSQTLVLALLLLVALGWTINYLQIPHLAILVPVGSFLFSINVLLLLATQLTNSQHDMHHTFDATTGRILIIIRILIGIAFIFICIYTYSQSRYRVKQFLIKFGILGGCYIFAMPLIVDMADMYIPARSRNQFVFIFVEGVKSISNVTITRMLSSTKSEYNKLSYRNASFLPNNAGF